MAGTSSEESSIDFLIVNKTYRRNFSNENLNKLLAVSSNGGFRKVLDVSTKNSKYNKKNAYIVIITSGNEPDWPDFIDEDNGTLTYYGDNTDPDAYFLNTNKEGNFCLSRYFHDLEEGISSDIPPFILFHSVSDGFIFKGIAAVGIRGHSTDEDLVKVHVDKNGKKLYNYKANFTILEDKRISLEWLRNRKNGNPDADDMAPPSWRAYLQSVKEKTFQKQTKHIVKDYSENFFEYLSHNNLYFDTELVEDFLLSLKAKQFLILSGGTGTGKTRIAQAYGQFISRHSTGEGSGKDANYITIPVGSNWTDNRPILGYMNILGKKYERTPALDIILRANEDPENPYLMILDEMNLSHVEHYFSDILSSMESDESIPLESSDNNVPSMLKLPRNLFIIGTVNIDETTYSFSPKVLDRANVIEFESADVMRFLNRSGDAYKPLGDVPYLQDCMDDLDIRDMNAPDIIDILRKSGNEVSIEWVISDLVRIQELMSRMRVPFGYRTLDEVMRFMYAGWKYKGSNVFDGWEKYLDSQIVEKILPKVHGNTSIRNDLEMLESLCRGDEGTYPDYKYRKSANKLQKMLKVLENQHYVSFNC